MRQDLHFDVPEGKTPWEAAMDEIDKLKEREKRLSDHGHEMEQKVREVLASLADVQNSLHEREVYFDELRHIYEDQKKELATVETVWKKRWADNEAFWVKEKRRWEDALEVEATRREAVEATLATVEGESAEHEETQRVLRLTIRERDAARADAERLAVLLDEWLNTPFFETQEDWQAWVDEFRPRVREALRLHDEGMK